MSTLLLQSQRESHKPSQIGKSTKKMTPEEQKRSDVLQAYREEMEKKFESKIREAEKRGDMEGVEHYRDQIKTAVAERSREL